MSAVSVWREKKYNVPISRSTFNFRHRLIDESFIDDWTQKWRTDWTSVTGGRRLRIYHSIIISFLIFILLSFSFHFSINPWNDRKRRFHSDWYVVTLKSHLFESFYNELVRKKIQIPFLLLFWQALHAQHLVYVKSLRNEGQ